MLKKLLFSLTLALFCFRAAVAQNVEMADAMRANGKIYVVVVVAAIVVITMLAYLISIDRRVNRLEQNEQKR